jgi:glutathione synthase/RimK-type ligase-like ATP-grasp enzyme
MNNIFIYPYRRGSASAAGLANALSVPRISHNNSRFRASTKKTVINWGATEVPAAVNNCGRVLNKPQLIRNASNKRIFFEQVAQAGEEGPRVPDWTLDPLEAASWIEQREAKLVFARTVLSGHSGEGIVQYDSAEALSSAPRGVLYVKYVPKREEYRVHVSRLSGIFSVQKKLKRFDATEPNYRIRNHANGFIYARENVRLPNEDSELQAIRALRTTGLDFGAVDLIFNERRGHSYVLEVNTAPGLEGTTVLEYAEEIKRLLDEE